MYMSKVNELLNGMKEKEAAAEESHEMTEQEMLDKMAEEDPALAALVGHTIEHSEMILNLNDRVSNLESYVVYLLKKIDPEFDKETEKANEK